ncbi:MAG TPA: class I SAM-dependent methyltransferase [Terriglobales bacterium]|jgi:SAM-dependent methyltransferase|nr:class I SAM-dependent methyltransferase [Terriglobales bacterium]
MDHPDKRNTACPMCSNRLDPYLSGKPDPETGLQFDVLKCVVCGMGITSPAPEQLRPHYAEYYGARHSVTASFCDRRRIALVTKMAGPGRGRRLLDIGCGEGTFLEVAGKHGWQVVGTELNSAPAQRAGLEVFNTLDECESRGPFDCVTLWHSLEHMPDPWAVITRIRRLVAQDGVLLIAVPDFDGLQSRTFGSNWLHLDLPRHLYHFTAAAMDGILHQSEFVPIAHWHQEFEYDLFGWLQSALNRVLPTPNVLFHFLTGKKRRGTVMEKIAGGISAPIFSLISLPLVWFGAIAGKGGTLLVAARTTGRAVEKARSASASGD